MVFVVTRSSSPKTVFICVSFCVLVLEIFPVHPCGRFFSSISKTVFICISFCVFGFGDFAGSSIGRFHPSNPLHNLCSVSSCHPLSNKIGFTRLGVSTQKLFSFWFLLFFSYRYYRPPGRNYRWQFRSNFRRPLPLMTIRFCSERKWHRNLFLYYRYFRKYRAFFRKYRSPVPGPLPGLLPPIFSVLASRFFNRKFARKWFW